MIVSVHPIGRTFHRRGSAGLEKGGQSNIRHQYSNRVCSTALSSTENVIT